MGSGVRAAGPRAVYPTTRQLPSLGEKQRAKMEARKRAFVSVGGGDMLTSPFAGKTVFKGLCRLTSG